jgi:arsenate reductase
MLFIEYPKCSTCQKAKKYLIDNNCNFESRNIVTETPTKEELDSYIKKSGKDISKFFNTSGLKYKELGLKDKLKNMSYEEKLQLLSSNGMLIKRPLLVTNNTVLTGFLEKEWSDNI